MSSPPSPPIAPQEHTSGTASKRRGGIAQTLTRIVAGVPASVRRFGNSSRLSVSSANLLQPISKITRKDIKRASSCGAGGFGKVLVLDHQGLGKVALKRLTTRDNMEDDTLRRNTLREGITWQSLSHPNVLPFLGILEDEECLYLVSPFVTNGTLDAYLNIHPDVDRPKLLWEAAGAIAYLHNCHIVHGDIKASNMLVSGDIHVLLCDFGLTRPDDVETSAGLKDVGTTRFKSPELLDGQGKTFESDSWAFGMTIYQVLSGKLPFYDARGPAVINEVLNKHSRPPKLPSHSGSGESYAWIWNVAESCWQTLPAKRPSMQEVYRQLRPRMTALVGHSDWIRCLAFAPDGKTIASGSYDNTVRWWDIDSGVQKDDALEGHTDWVQSVVFSFDVKTIISGSNDRTIRRWEVESGRQASQTSLGLAYWIQCLAFSPGRDTIASGANDRTIRLWDVESGSQKGDALRGHTDWVGCLAFSPDGKTIVSGSNDRTLRLWDVELATQIGGVMGGHMDWVLCVAFSPDGQTIISGSKDRTIRIWSVESMMERGNPLTGHADWVECLAFSPDGRTIASGSNDRTIRFWDLDSGAEMGDALIGHTDWVFCLTFSPDGKTLASGSYDMTVRLWILDDNS